jgi:hypothetical protein
VIPAERFAELRRLAAADAGPYIAFDQERWLGVFARAARRWTHPEQVPAWEAAHGHDLRLNCYPEYGCQVVAAELANGLLELLDDLDDSAGHPTAVSG